MKAYDLFTGEAVKPIRAYDDLVAISKASKIPLSNIELLTQILKNSDIELTLKTIGTGFAARTVTVGTTPVEIIKKAKYPRGYILLNSTPTTGLTTGYNVYPQTTITTPATVYSNALGVAAYLKAHAFLNITGMTGVVTVQVNLRTYDPISNNPATVQNDIFSSPTTTGTFYAYLGELGIGGNIDFEISASGGTNITLAINVLLKYGIGGTASGFTNNIYIGGSDVTVTNGYPLMEGQKETFFLKDGVALYAVSQGSVSLKIFELQ